MTQQNQDAPEPVGADGLQIKQRIADEKADKKTGPFDLGASSLGTDNEAGAAPDPDGMAQARKAPPPK